MDIVFGLVVIVILGAIVVVATGHGEGLPAADPDVTPLPEGELDANALRRARFSIALRGYRMAEVDEILERIAVQLEGRADGAREPSGQ